MQVFVKSFTGHSLLFSVEAEQSVRNFKSNIQEELGCLSDDLRLIFEGKNLNGENTLEEFGVREASTIEAVLSLKGGKKKKKRKAYTSAKKNKHRHINVQLRTLVYYSINQDDEKVVRQRSYCPDKGCGPGVRLAKHKDRYHCGKCGKTLRIE